jgi:hypothetical protein
MTIRRSTAAGRDWRDLANRPGSVWENNESTIAATRRLGSALLPMCNGEWRNRASTHVLAGAPCRAHLPFAEPKLCEQATGRSRCDTRGSARRPTGPRYCERTARTRPLVSTVACASTACDHLREPMRRGWDSGSAGCGVHGAFEPHYDRAHLHARLQDGRPRGRDRQACGDGRTTGAALRRQRDPAARLDHYVLRFQN